MRTLLPLLVLAVLLAAPVARAADVAKPAASDDEVRQLINQLGSDSYAKREAASKRLKAIGKPALGALKAALDSGDAEVVSRARALVRRLEIRPVPGPDPAFNGANLRGLGLRPGRVSMSVVDGARVIEVNDAGRDIRITDGPDGIAMTVTGFIDGQQVTEEYGAPDAAQLQEEAPDAYALYEQWVDGGGRRFIVRGNGRIQVQGGGIVLNGGIGGGAPVGIPDELDLLRSRLEKQMGENGLKPAQRDEVNKALDELVRARTDRLPNTGMDKYVEQCDEFRKVIDAHKLDAGDLLPPPAKTRLGVSLLPGGGLLEVKVVSEGSRAERLGLKAGDVIRKVDGKDVATVLELRKVVGAKEKGLVIEVTRDGEELKLTEKDEPKK
jgi:hypothetical protein